MKLKGMCYEDTSVNVYDCMSFRLTLADSPYQTINYSIFRIASQNVPTFATSIYAQTTFASFPKEYVTNLSTVARP